MNSKKILGLAIVLVALLFPLKYAILNTEGVSNMTGLISFLILMIGLFAGYFLIDSAGANKSHGEH